MTSSSQRRRDNIPAWRRNKELKLIQLHAKLDGMWDPEADTHWVCPDCGQPCSCTDELARSAPHAGCGRPIER